MAEQVNYTEDSIRSLDWREHIRLRPGMYIGKLGDGSAPDDGIYVLVKEILDNSIDEHMMGHGRVIEVKITEHIVDRGENLGIIARKYDVSISDIKDWNKIEDSNIQLGAKLVVGKKYVVLTDTKNTQTKKENIAVNDRDEVKLYYVKKGDSLFSIAKKYPGVSISDLKKWNGIKSERLKAGMKLKING